MIFNLWALIPLALIVTSILGLDYAFPAFTNGPYGDLAASVIVVAIGAVTELCRIPARVLFMPVWLLGLFMVSLHVIIVWGWFGIAAPVMLLAAGIVWILKRVRISEHKKWTEAKESLAGLNSHANMKNSYSFWKLIRTCLYLPGINSFSDEICLHNLIVTDAALLVLADNSNPKVKQEWESLRDYFSKWPNSEKKPNFNLETQKIIEDFLTRETQDGDKAMEILKNMDRPKSKKEIESITGKTGRL